MYTYIFNIIIEISLGRYNLKSLSVMIVSNDRFQNTKKIKNKKISNFNFEGKFIYSICLVPFHLYVFSVLDIYMFF